MQSLLVFVHVSGVVVWVGGMAFAHFCLRPAAVESLDPPLRLALWRGVLRRFFPIVSAAVAAIVVSGVSMYFRVAVGTVPAGWYWMFAVGIVMAVIYLYILLAIHPRFAACVDARDWPAAGAQLARIRRLVGINLTLGVLTIAAATLAVGWG